MFYIFLSLLLRSLLQVVALKTSRHRAFPELVLWLGWVSLSLSFFIMLILLFFLSLFPFRSISALKSCFSINPWLYQTPHSTLTHLCQRKTPNGGCWLTEDDRLLKRDPPFLPSLALNRLRSAFVCICRYESVVCSSALIPRELQLSSRASDPLRTLRSNVVWAVSGRFTARCFFVIKCKSSPSGRGIGPYNLSSSLRNSVWSFEPERCNCRARGFACSSGRSAPDEQLGRIGGLRSVYEPGRSFGLGRADDREKGG